MKKRRMMKTKGFKGRFRKHPTKPAETPDGLSAHSARRPKPSKKANRATPAHKPRPSSGALVFSASTEDPQIVGRLPLRVRPRSNFTSERAAYQSRRPRLLEDDALVGKLVVFVGDEMIGPFRSLSDALRAGYRKFGLGPLYIKRVVAEEAVTDSGATAESCRS
jgi:hypothetical protein